MSLYEFIIKDKNGKALGSLDGARRRSFATYLNKAGEARFILSLTDSKITQDMLLLGNKELYIYRAGTLVWGGELVYSRSDLSDSTEQIEVTAKGFLDLLSKRYAGTAATPRTFTDEDIVTIARTLVSETQALTNGDFGITLGTNPTSRNGDRTYSFTPIKQALEELSNDNIQNGIDYEITADKKFNCYYPTKGRSLPEVQFEYGVNITEFFEILDAVDMVNQAIVLGSGEGQAMLTSTRNSPVALQQAYKLRQGIFSHKSVVKQSTLDEHGDNALAQQSAQKQLIGAKTKGNLPPGFGAYSVGDSVRVKIKYGILSIDAMFRVHGIETSISDEDEEDITVIFSAT